MYVLFSWFTDHCGGKLEGTQGTFTSPNYPEYYPSDSDCTWKISVPSKSKIELSFSSIALEPGFDYVDVYDGPTLGSKIIARLWGVVRPAPLVSSGNQMLVRFVSDYSVQNRGFSATYKAGEYFFCFCVLHVVAMFHAIHMIASKTLEFEFAIALRLFMERLLKCRKVLALHEKNIITTYFVCSYFDSIFYKLVFQLTIYTYTHKS